MQQNHARNRGGHTTLEDTDIAITLDTNNNFYPHAMIPSANLSSIINDRVAKPGHFSKSPRLGDFRHSKGSPRAGNVNPLLIESMDSRHIEDMTARRRS